MVGVGAGQPMEGGNCFELKRDQLDFAYRHSRLQHDNLVVLSARFRLQPGHDPDELKRVTTANLSHCLLYTSPSPRDLSTSRMPSSA